MYVLIKALFGFFVPVALLAACATSPSPSYFYNEIVVSNKSGKTLWKLSFTIPETGRSYTCASIEPRSICARRFATRRLEGKPIRIDWATGGAAPESQEILIPPALTGDRNDPLKGVLVYDSQGNWTARSYQKTWYNL